ncbi:uncharacterized protein LOC131702164 [Acipenser ruthenus]|uniref:uncharacterized protein LOC131702164 n=1 Tax=Acipenser ruthenus TaxID=7906 RepID=UPI002740D425|nr:uncharacterized protein LOC131702164 [Acipenser ruthenus]XP_058860364.1 uncharacterized protein LOC131702164 [Acipenser ruthenus]
MADFANTNTPQVGDPDNASHDYQCTCAHLKNVGSLSVQSDGTFRCNCGETPQMSFLPDSEIAEPLFHGFCHDTVFERQYDFNFYKERKGQLRDGSPCLVNECAVGCPHHPQIKLEPSSCDNIHKLKACSDHCSNIRAQYERKLQGSQQYINQWEEMIKTKERVANMQKQDEPEKVQHLPPHQHTYVCQLCCRTVAKGELSGMKSTAMMEPLESTVKSHVMSCHGCKGSESHSNVCDPTSSTGRNSSYTRRVSAAGCSCPRPSFSLTRACSDCAPQEVTTPKFYQGHECLKTQMD